MLINLLLAISILISIASIGLLFWTSFKYQKVIKKMERLQEQKTEFVSIASHQLRGPVSVIYGYVSMILEGDYGKIPQKIKEPLYRSLRSSQAMGLLINDYLDATQIDRGDMEYMITKLDLTKMLNDILEEFSLVARKASLELTFKKPKDDVMIMADKNKIRQIITNVIDNAIKYTLKGKVNITLDKIKDKAIISVKDTGIGIDEEKANEIFNKFARSPEAIKINVVGTGLGLFVAKTMIEAQDGNIWVNSNGLGKGSTFYISIPIAKED